MTSLPISLTDAQLASLAELSCEQPLVGRLIENLHYSEGRSEMWMKAFGASSEAHVTAATELRQMKRWPFWRRLRWALWPYPLPALMDQDE